jgi:hypothetical protein
MRRFERDYESPEPNIQKIIELCEDISLEDFYFGPLDDKLELIIHLAGGKRK